MRVHIARVPLFSAQTVLFDAGLGAFPQPVLFPCCDWKRRGRPIARARGKGIGAMDRIFLLETSGHLIVMVAGELDTPPIVTTTGCAPDGIPVGTCTLICVTPASP